MKEAEIVISVQRVSVGYIGLVRCWLGSAELWKQSAKAIRTTVKDAYDDAKVLRSDILELGSGFETT